MNRYALLVLAFVVALMVGCGASAKNKIVVASDATWPPMEYVDENKEIVGFDIDLIKAIAEKGGFEVEIRNTAWDGIFAGLANGSYDAVISSVTITEERKNQMDFSEPYINAGQVIVVKKGTKGTTLADFEGKKMGGQIGTTGVMEIQKNPKITLKTYDEIGLAIEDLYLGRIDGVVVDAPTAASFVLQNPKYKDALMIASEPFTEEYYGIAVRKGNKRVLDLINKGLAEVKKAGIDKELEKKWLR
ncbi:basic amino acid ABC transporter substrate-binding protein [Thermospira aquatica]|uniref:Basic amino acid ABC transporter substrate-binding protein n=1 Tax=Thermospira aquatica TaxID=2828656 RepID=A0AAX3BF34_9SPIR|nr:basic amino acid ABC transporter substrate-binding protein [Thermospira aquatica]URA10880.1 basic amino acid ABC transporter substrate-binding protein [Thermospira aquatica]